MNGRVRDFTILTIGTPLLGAKWRAVRRRRISILAGTAVLSLHGGYCDNGFETGATIKATEPRRQESIQALRRTA